MLIFTGSPGSHIAELVTQIQDHNPPFSVSLYEQWNHGVHAKGFVYIHVTPEIAQKRISQESFHPSTSIETFKYEAEKHSIPLLELNGNIDFRTDFAQFYNHLFYIKKFYQHIKDEEDKKNGTYIERPKHKGCGC